MENIVRTDVIELSFQNRSQLFDKMEWEESDKETAGGTSDMEREKGLGHPGAFDATSHKTWIGQAQ